MRKPVIALLCAALGLLMYAGAAAAAPTKAEFIRRGDAVCARVQRQLAPLRRQAEAAKSLPREEMWGAATRLWTAQIRIQRQFVRQFRALGVPAGDAKARALVAGLGRGVTLAVRVRDAFAARSTAALARTLPAYLRYTLALNRRVAAYGFRVCGR